MNYYGLDWLAQALVAVGVWQLGNGKRWAYVVFMVANVVSFTVHTLATPPILGSQVGATFFFLLHLRAWRRHGKSRASPGST